MLKNKNIYNFDFELPNRVFSRTSSKLALTLIQETLAILELGS